MKAEYTLTIKIKNIGENSFDIEMMSDNSIPQVPSTPADHAVLRVFEAVEREFGDEKGMALEEPNDQG